MDFILGFNIGNTNTMLGLYSPDKISPEETYSYKTDKKTTTAGLVREIGNIINILSEKRNISITGLAFSSVATEVNEHYHKTAGELFGIKALEINSDIRHNIKIIYDNPAELGADRIANAVAVYNEYKKDTIIIDLGTANTFCVIHENGTFDGGLIGPGIGLSIEALAEKTSKLMRVEFEKPKSLIATNTRDAIKSGFFYGYFLMIEGIIGEIEKIYGKEFLVIMTGGYSKSISSYLKHHHTVDPMLTMKGIKYLYDMNKKQ